MAAIVVAMRKRKEASDKNLSPLAYSASKSQLPKEKHAKENDAKKTASELLGDSTAKTWGQMRVEMEGKGVDCSVSAERNDAILDAFKDERNVKLLCRLQNTARTNLLCTPPPSFSQLLSSPSFEPRSLALFLRN